MFSRRSMRLSLPVKFLVLVLVGVFLPLELSLVYFLRTKERELDQAFLRQGRVMADQIVIMRQWLSKQGGVYVRKRPHTRTEEQYLGNVDTSTIDGDPITLRSTFGATRELSELAASVGLSQFRIVSLNPINPQNLPDPWEEAALLAFESGAAVEAGEVAGAGKDARYRYIAALRTETDCHRCHIEHGYPMGGVRGGISVEFPVGEILTAAARSNRAHAVIAAVLGLGIIALLGTMVRRTVLRPLSGINRAVSAMAEGDYDRELALGADDELGDLGRTVIQVRAVLRDYSRRLEDEVALRTGELDLMRARAQKERDYLINIFERMEDGVCVVRSPGHEVEYINPSLAAVFGEGGRRDCFRLFFGEGDGDEGAGPDLAAGAVVRREVTAPNGERIFDVLASELTDPDGSRLVLFVFRDITGRKRLERELVEMNRDLETKVAEAAAALVEQERMATLGEVSAGLAHEIRNPLSAILSGISLLEGGRRTVEERAHIFHLIRKEAARLNAALTDFLLYARPHEPKKVRIDLAGLVREICQMIRDDAELSGQIQISLDLADMPPVWFDDDQLRQLVWNIALNGVQAMSGQGRLQIRTRDLKDGWWKIEIQDDGTGVPPEIMKQIYDPFFSTKKGGTGLGLAIVRRIVKAHAAVVSAENMPGGGCRFTVTAPFGGQDG